MLASSVNPVTVVLCATRIDIGRWPRDFSDISRSRSSRALSLTVSPSLPRGQRTPLMSSDSLSRQIAFIVEADRLKTIIRRTPLTDSSRLENSAEHSWHLAVAAIALREHAPPSVDLARVLEMVAIHDLVEIDAGDTFRSEERRVGKECA